MLARYKQSSGELTTDAAPAPIQAKPTTQAEPTTEDEPGQPKTLGRSDGSHRPID